MNIRPNILTISGFDPSNGAGLSADIKTIENLRCYALSVCSANTVQNDVKFSACYWTHLEIMNAQIRSLAERFDFEYVKVGIIENWEILNQIVDTILSINPNSKIILDPVLRSSSNHTFHDSNEDWKLFESILGKVFLITPNYDEIQAVFPSEDIKTTISKISRLSHLFLKGGHRSGQIGKDELFTVEGESYSFNPKTKRASEKHGSGCILSSAIASYLALGYPLLKACYRAKRYTEQRLESNQTLLAYHKM